MPWDDHARDLQSNDPTLLARTETDTAETWEPEPPSSIVDLVAREFAEAVSRIWSGRRRGEYLAALDARRHLWHACLASNHPAFQPTNSSTVESVYQRLTFERGKTLLAQA